MARSSARSSFPASARRAVSAANAPTPRRFTLSPASPRRRASIATIWSPAKASCIRQAKVKFNPDDYEVKQVFYTSKDGTKVPMFITAQEGHQAGRLESDAAVRLRRFQHPADAGVLRSRAWPGWRWAASTRWPTCAAAASTARSGTRPAPSCTSRTSSTISSPRREWLIDNKYTRPDKLAIQGGSNGGLLVGAVHDAAAGPVRRLPAGGRRHGHAALPQVHGRPVLGGRLRLAGQCRRSSRRSTPIRRITISRRAQSIRRRW